jgi:hypothetical protein
VSLARLPETATQTATMPAPVEIPDAADLLDGMEHLRIGTRDQYESEWVRIEGVDFVGTHEFTHGLGEIPWVVDVLQSTRSDGANPTPAIPGGTDVTVTKTATTITVQNDDAATVDVYFQVRAM